MDRRLRYSIIAIDIIWHPTKSKIRFVLVECGRNRIILMSSSLEFDPLTIIQLYGHRFKIEVTIKGSKTRCWCLLLSFLAKSDTPIQEEKPCQSREI